jgi:HEAT repeat protein
LAELVRALADKAPEARAKAAAELVALGPLAVPALHEAARDVDEPEGAGNARRCLQAVEGPAGAAIPAAAARLLARGKPAGAAEALLAYLPFADDERVGEEVKAALAAVAFPEGKPEPALLRALTDPVSLRRAVAAEVLCEAATGEPPAAVRNLLHDAQPVVRLRAALALAELKDEQAVSALISLLAELPRGRAKQAEDYLYNLAGEQGPKVPLGNDAASAKKCRDTWSVWWARSDGPGLLVQFRKRALSDADRERAQELIKKLGDDSFEVREKATADLAALGKFVLPLLRPAAASTDPEVSERARKCLEKIGKEDAAPLTAVAARLVAYRKPAGAAEALLAYLPLAADQAVAAEVRAALIEVAVREGKPEPAVVRALQDGSPQRRAAAAEALCWAGAAEQRPAVRRLLQDPQPLVRLHAALALAGTREKQAVPVLIALLASLPPEQAADAEECLRRLGGRQAPAVPLGADEAGRRKCRDAWDAWWREHGAQVEMIDAPRPGRLPRYLGCTLLILADAGEVLELGANGQPRWRLTGLQYPADAQVLPGNRVLIAEVNARRVTERNLRNEILWQKEANWPIACQRLANGNTFIVTRNQLVEVDRAGKEVFVHNHPNGDIMAALRLRDGRIVCSLQAGACQWLDAAGNEVKTFPVGQVMTNGLDVLANGHVLLPQLWLNKVIEYDGDGRPVWEAAVPQPSAAVRLANGNTLVASQWPPKALEVDRGGKVVWEYGTNIRVHRAKRR